MQIHSISFHLIYSTVPDLYDFAAVLGLTHVSKPMKMEAEEMEMPKIADRIILVLLVFSGMKLNTAKRIQSRYSKK